MPDTVGPQMFGRHGIGLKFMTTCGISEKSGRARKCRVCAAVLARYFSLGGSQRAELRHDLMENSSRSVSKWAPAIANRRRTMTVDHSKPARGSSGHQW